MDDENRFIEQRREKLGKLRELGQAYPNQFEREDFAGSLSDHYDAYNKEDLDPQAIQVRLAGRMMRQRDSGKVIFADLQDMTGKIQIFLALNAIGETAFEAFKQCDIGDIFGVIGKLF